MDPDPLRDKSGTATAAGATSAGDGRSSSAKVHQYSIWAMPDEGSAFHASASAAISNLSTRFGCTAFEPHVTVIGAFGETEGLNDREVVRRMEQLGKSLKPYDIHVMELASGRLFFQCVYLKMLPSNEVLHVHDKAVEVMGMDRDASAAYMPHLSLIYGDLSDDQKQEAKAAVGKAFPSLLPPTPTSSLPSPAFHVASLALYRTEPTDLTMSTWERIGVFPLTGTV
ncbi:hypothetical protein CLOM_g15854 [Closterium sp. NIES-68]|nr:hypothetical protein CLOM_g15854 [Closterium sp. NIES-68]GJP64798.1 hypothetical protein CLOP_g21744 [Closterium sp. NIES-67]